jgi:hypothetical protein
LRRRSSERSGGKKRKDKKAWWPDTYEALVAQLMREHPGHTHAQMEAAIVEAQRKEAK